MNLRPWHSLVVAVVILMMGCGAVAGHWVEDDEGPPEDRDDLPF